MKFNTFWNLSRCMAASEHNKMCGEPTLAFLAQAARNSGTHSWEEDVRSYVQCQDTAAEPFHTQRRALSSALLSTSMSDSKAADFWWVACGCPPIPPNQQIKESGDTSTANHKCCGRSVLGFHKGLILLTVGVFRWSFLANEEAALAGAGANVTVELGAKMGRQAITLFQLYKWATRVLPKRNSDSYLQLWLGYARHQG